MYKDWDAYERFVDRWRRRRERRAKPFLHRFSLFGNALRKVNMRAGSPTGVRSTGKISIRNAGLKLAGRRLPATHTPRRVARTSPQQSEDERVSVE